MNVRFASYLPLVNKPRKQGLREKLVEELIVCIVVNLHSLETPPDFVCKAFTGFGITRSQKISFTTDYNHLEMLTVSN